MNKFKKKDVYNYMPRFDDASSLHSVGSKNVRTLGEPREFINLVQNQSLKVMWTKTHVRKLKVKTLVDSGCSKTIFTDRSLFSDYTPYKTSIQTAGGEGYLFYWKRHCWQLTELSPCSRVKCKSYIYKSCM